MEDQIKQGEYIPAEKARGVHTSRINKGLSDDQQISINRTNNRSIKGYMCDAKERYMEDQQNKARGVYTSRIHKGLSYLPRKNG